MPHSTKSAPSESIPSPLNRNSIDHKLAKQLKIDKLSLGSSHKSAKRKSSSSSHHRHSKHESKRKRRKKKKSIEASYSDSDSELSKGKIKDKIKKISIRVPGDPNGIYKHWKRTKSHLKSTLLKTKSSPHLNIFNEEEEDLHLNGKQILNIDESCKLGKMETNPLYSFDPKTHSHHNNHHHHHHHHKHHYHPHKYRHKYRNHHQHNNVEYEQKGDNRHRHNIKTKHIEMNMKNSGYPMDDQHGGSNRLQRDRLNSYPPNNVIFTFKSPNNLSSPSSSMSNASISNSSVIPMLKKSQSCSNLFDDDQYKRIARNNVKLDELMLTNKAIIIHTPTKNGNNNNKDEDEHKHINNHYDHHFYPNNYNYSVLGWKSYQNKKKHKENVKNNTNETQLRFIMSFFSIHC